MFLHIHRKGCFLKSQYQYINWYEPINVLGIDFYGYNRVIKGISVLKLLFDKIICLHTSEQVCYTRFCY